VPTLCLCARQGDLHSQYLCPPQGRFTIAAKHHITIAEIYEAELVDIEKVRVPGLVFAAVGH